MIDQKNAPENLTDSELDEVTGGYIFTHDKTTDKYYRWGNGDENKRFLCPNCKRPVHKGGWDRFYCDPCDASWYDLHRLRPNIAAGGWIEISKEEYY